MLSSGHLVNTEETQIMATNNNINYNPTPLPGAVPTPVLGNNIDRAPEAVAPGAGLGYIPTVPQPVVAVSEQPVINPPIPAARNPVVIPVAEQPVVTPVAGSTTAPNITASNQQRYITILANGTVITNNASTLDFEGNGFTITSAGVNGATISIDAAASGYGNSNVTTLLAGFGSNTLSTTGNVTAGNILARSVANVGNLTVAAGGAAWFFGTDGVLTLSGGATLKEGVALGALALGYQAGQTSQGIRTVAIGQSAGQTSQGARAVAVGLSAGATSQGGAAVAIGAFAGATSQGTNSIIINATGANLDQTTANTFTVAPVRNDVANTANVMFYNATSNEITYGNVIGVVGNITGGNLLTGGLISATANITGGNITTAGVLKISGASSYIDVAGTGFIQNGGTGELQISSVASKPVWINTNAGAKLWAFGIDGNLALPSGGAVSGTGNITGGNLLTGGLISATGNITANNVSLTGNGFVSFTSGSTLTFGDTPVTNRYYVDATRTSETYVRNGSQARPFNTIATAQSAIATAIAGGLNPEVTPVYIILLSNVTENVTLATNHVYLVGQNGQIHQPIILTGNVTVQPTSGTLSSNHFSITGIEVVGGTDGKAIYVTGTFPLRLSLQDVWITANGNSGAGIYQDNSGSGTYTHGGPLKVSHNGVGDVYCFDIINGTASFESVETSGATQVGAAKSGATLTFNGSQLEANGDVVAETYGSGVLVITNSLIKNSAVNSYGIKLNAVANVAGTVSVGQSAFNVPLGAGQAVWLDPNTTPGLSGVFAWGGATFYPGTNTTIAPLIIPGPLATLVGTIASPILYGDITSYSVAQDWDLIDNNASALSFDTTGKAGVLELVTTNSAEGVKMSGFASAVGNVTGGNLLTGSRVITTPVAYSTLAAVSGARAFVNDGNLVASGNFGAQVIGGGSNVVPVWSNGTNWYIG